MKCDKCGRDHPSRHYFKADGICDECFRGLDEPQQAELLRALQEKYSKTTTAFEIDGHRIVRSLGVVRGVTVRSRSIFGTLGATLQTLVGGNITMFTELCEKTRAEAFEMMLRHAQELGANAVIGVRYDATEVMDGVNEVLCYGTAVVIEPAS
jgi:uncharacterized protein YbjQ (UPF0145 family)